jgi:DNA-binding GntR family transcriptional regulator
MAAPGVEEKMTGKTLKTQAKSKVSQLARRIEEDITLGLLGGDTWLRQADLEQTYGCTRLRLREALDRLVDKGLVRLESNRGYKVVDLDVQKLAEILQVRAVLEVAAAEEIYNKFDAASLRHLKSLAKSFEQSVEEGTVIEQEQANRLFHASMLSHCSNSELVDLIFELRNRTPLSPNRRKNTPARVKQAAKEHYLIIDALRNKDLPGLCTLLRQHVLGELLNKESGRTS